MNFLDIIKRLVENASREVLALAQIVQNISRHGRLPNAWQSSKVYKFAIVLQLCDQVEEIYFSRNEVLNFRAHVLELVMVAAAFKSSSLLYPAVVAMLRRMLELPL